MCSVICNCCASSFVHSSFVTRRVSLSSILRIWLMLCIECISGDVMLLGSPVGAWHALVREWKCQLPLLRPLVWHQILTSSSPSRRYLTSLSCGSNASPGTLQGWRYPTWNLRCVSPNVLRILRSCCMSHLHYTSGVHVVFTDEINYAMSRVLEAECVSHSRAGTGAPG